MSGNNYIHKLSLFLILMSSCLSLQTAYSQVFTTHKPTPASTSLTQLLNWLKQEKQVAFLYEPATIKNIYINTDFNKGDPVKVILKEILPPVGLTYKKVGRYNYIIKKGKSFIKKNHSNLNKKPTRKKINLPTPSYISGHIKDALEHQPLIGATVRIKDTGLGTISDSQGHFQLDLPPGPQVLSIEYLGFETREIQVNGHTQQNILLQEQSTKLHEIIVTAAGIEKNKRSLGYAADNIDLNRLPMASEPNIVSTLTAQSAGVWVNSASGAPGASASIFIRGLRSVNGSNKPLFVLDGMPIDNTTIGNTTTGVDVSNRLIDLNPHDIEKMTILKGAAATALYGIRATNGAIVMTSKKGHQGRPRIHFSSSIGWNKPNQLPKRQNQYAQGKYKNGLATYLGPETNTSSSYGPLISQLEFDGDTSYPYDQNGRLVPIGQGNGQAANVYDPYKTFFVNGQTLDNHLSIAGGTNWFDYFFSFGQFRETGFVPKADFNRYSARGAFQVRLDKKWRIGTTTQLVRSGGSRMKRGSQFSGVPLGLFRNPISFDIGNGKTGRAAANSPDAYILDNGTQRAYRGNGRYDNPFWSVNRNPFQDQVNRLIQHLDISYQINPWLAVQYRNGLDVYSDDRSNAFDIHSGTHRNGQIDLLDIQSTNFNGDLMLTATTDLSTNWTIHGSLGYNYFASKFSIKETKGRGLEKQGLYLLSNASNITNEDQLLRKKLAGVYTDLHIRFKNILYLNLTGRNDWSSTLPVSNNAFFYPSLNVGFEFSELLGLNRQSFLSFGKLRLSLSKVGNDAGSYLTTNYFVPATVNGDPLLPNIDFPAFGLSAFEASGVLGNPQLKPETTQTIELGTDLKFFKGKLQLDVTWYRSIQKDQIINAQLSASSGYLQTPVNAGRVRNQGLEVLLTTTLLRKKDFSWQSSINFSTFESIVTHLPESTPSISLASFTNISSMILEGQPYGMLVGTAFKRNAAGQKIIDDEGFPMVNETQTIIGNPNPDWLMGIHNEWQWKRFRLSALLDIRKGGDIWNGTRGVLSYLGLSAISGEQRDVQNHLFEGVRTTGEINTQTVDLANPANGMEGIYWRRYGFIGLAEEHIEDGSWIRLRNIRLAYTWTPSWFWKNPSDVSIALIGHNVFLFSPYSGIDPETNLRGDSNILGWDYFNMPNEKGWSLQLNVQF